MGYYGNTSDLMKTLKISETSGVWGQYFQSHLSFPCPWMTSLVAQMVKHLPTMQDTQLQSLGQENLEKKMATHSNILAWKIPWTEEPGRLQSMGSQRVRHDWTTSFHFTSSHAYEWIRHKQVKQFWPKRQKYRKGIIGKKFSYLYKKYTFPPRCGKSY